MPKSRKILDTVIRNAYTDSSLTSRLTSRLTNLSYLQFAKFYIWLVLSVFSVDLIQRNMINHVIEIIDLIQVACVTWLTISHLSQLLVIEVQKLLLLAWFDTKYAQYMDSWENLEYAVHIVKHTRQNYLVVSAEGRRRE